MPANPEIAQAERGEGIGMRFNILIRTLAATVLVMLATATARAQTPPPAISNPIMRMVASQPPIDITSPVVATTSFDPPVVLPGERAVYRITMNAMETSIRLPDHFPEPNGLRFRASAKAQTLQAATNILRPFTTFNFAVRAERPGVFVVPTFIVAVDGKPVTVPEAALEARAEMPSSHRRARQLILECDTTNAFIGQAIGVHVLSPAWESNIVQGLSQVEFNGDGFLPKKNPTRQTIATLEYEGRRVPTYIYDTIVTPISTGPLTLSAQGFTAGRHFSGPITIRGPVTIPGGPPQLLLLDSEPVLFNVKPLPTEGKLPGFTGGIGDFVLDPPTLGTNAVRVGDPVQLAVIIRSSGDLSRLAPPPPPQMKSWQVFAGNAPSPVEPKPNINPGVAFNYTLIPTTDEVRKTPAIPFSYFDPNSAEYVDLTIPPVPVTVIANGLPTELPRGFQSTDEEFRPKKQPVLSGLASSPGRLVSSYVPLQLRDWFLAIQLLPATGFLGLWLWDKRRCHLEIHPEIVRRRAARRQLHRLRHLMNRAAAKGDAPGYVRYAVAALQIACAPHYVAEPQALVCGDVLNILEASEREGRSGEVVRQLFAAADVSRFAASPRTPTLVKIFGLKPQVDDILLKMEERL